MKQRCSLGLCAALLSVSALAADSYQLDTIASDLHYPWALAPLADGSFLVTERTGQLKKLSASGETLFSIQPALPELYVAAQGGLLDMLLLPDFAASGRLLLSYSCGTQAANSTCLASATLRADQLADIQPLFQAKPLRRGAAHYGGRMVLLPDNTVLLTLGDGFDYREQAQNKANHLGKIVRLQLDGAAPTNNPFVNEPATAPEIYTLGHRNVQGIVFDSLNQQVYSHEHGPRGGDELNLLRAGSNYGWPVATQGIDYTGARISPYTEFSGMTNPLYVWTPSIAPSGMALYQHQRYPQWQGNVFITALAGKRLHRLELVEGQVVAEHIMLAELDSRLRDVRSGPDGAVYVLTDSAQGKLLRVTPP
ncbi:glucose dehydrogenase [Arsukibacterium ikkense]|uniref:Glucose dehydrogenase n=1 Tax=Arsukibacterium ikkense TaxID=336831 RepID=A0A0M2V4G4_9GAMM|nr:PQQ-dependent sugar dehydrogenase [Arsukibacterium ikkense]KKO45732.1 glucose dehydrogenase [Arsukibacterium ikkense]